MHNATPPLLGRLPLASLLGKLGQSIGPDSAAADDAGAEHPLTAFLGGRPFTAEVVPVVLQARAATPRAARTTNGAGPGATFQARATGPAAYGRVR